MTLELRKAQKHGANSAIVIDFAVLTGFSVAIGNLVLVFFWKVIHDFGLYTWDGHSCWYISILSILSSRWEGRIAFESFVFSGSSQQMTLVRAEAGVKNNLRQLRRSIIQEGSSHVTHVVLFALLCFTVVYLWSKFSRRWGLLLVVVPLIYLPKKTQLMEQEWLILIYGHSFKMQLYCKSFLNQTCQLW